MAQKPKNTLKTPWGVKATIAAALVGGVFSWWILPEEIFQTTLVIVIFIPMWAAVVVGTGSFVLHKERQSNSWGFQLLPIALLLVAMMLVVMAFRFAIFLQ